MQMVKIQIPEQADRAKGFVEMARRGRIVCLPDNVFVVPEPALELLDSLGCGYVELGRGDFDYAEKALRDARDAHATLRRSTLNRQHSTPDSHLP